MQDPYTTLGLTSDAEDTAIRKRFLELTLQYPPEQFPDKSAAIRRAYDVINTTEKRAEYHLYLHGKDDTIDDVIEQAQTLLPRPRPTLRQLIISTGPIEQ